MMIYRAKSWNRIQIPFLQNNIVAISVTLINSPSSATPPGNAAHQRPTAKTDKSHLPTSEQVPATAIIFNLCKHLKKQKGWSSMNDLCCNKVKLSSCKRRMIHAKFMRIRPYGHTQRCPYTFLKMLTLFAHWSNRGVRIESFLVLTCSYRCPGSPRMSPITILNVPAFKIKWLLQMSIQIAL